MIRETVTTPQGRLVRGDPYTTRKVMDFQDKTKQRVDKDGELMFERYIALAIPKGPAWEALWAQIWAVGLAGYNNAEPAGMSWKIDDGDNPKFAGKEGYPGCMVVNMNMNAKIDVGCYDENGNQILNQADLTCGDYADILLEIACDGHPSMPSVYLSQKIIRRAGRGPIIAGSANIGDMAPAAGMAAGSTAQRAGAPMAAPGAPAPAAPAPAAPAPAAPAPAAPAPAAPGTPAPVPPQAGGSVPSATPQPPQAPVPHPVPPVLAAATASPSEPVMTAAAQYTRAEYNLSGWSDERLIADGLMVAPLPGFSAGPPAT